VAETRRDGEGSRARHARGHRGEQSDAGATLIRLPAELAGRYEVVRELAVQGAEADVLLVRGASGEEFVAKVYRSGFTVDPSVQDRLARLDTAHLIAVVETGQAAGGRQFEVMEYAAGGTLRTLISQPDAGRPVGLELLAEVVRQVAEGLDTLHRAGIVHRDLKPDNVLVRTEAPLHLVLTDFGLSKAIDASMKYASYSRTLAYAAPESLAGRVSPALDWWALGVIVRELATGRRPFEGLSERVVLDHLSTRPIDLDEVTDPRVRLLCRGLLVRDPAHRWGHAQVREWLAGRSPAVADEPAGGRADAAGRQPLVFRRERLHQREEVARAFAAHWEDAARKYFAAMGSDIQPTEGWRTLLNWLRQFDDPERDDVEGRVELIDYVLAPQYRLSPDVKLLHLLRWLDPTMPPVYRGFVVTPAELPRLVDAIPLIADSAESSASAATRVVDDLANHRLLPVLSGFAGAAELADVDDRWQELIRDWDALAGELRLRLEPSTRFAVPLAGESAFVRAALLDLAANPAARAAALGEQARQASERIGGATTWFQLITWSRGGGDDPLRSLAAVCAAPAALAEIEQAEQRRRADEAAAAARQRRWDEFEANRRGGEDDAISQAVRGSLVALGLWVLVWLCAPAVYHGWALAAAVVLGLAACAGQAACEVLLARRLAGDYHPRWSFLGAVRLVSGQMWRRIRGTFSQAPGPAIFVTLVSVCCLPFFVFYLIGAIAVPLPVVVAVGHVGWAYWRFREWSSVHERYRAEVLGGAELGGPDDYDVRGVGG
jgi:tRNA A-37 threonylcarbamoyl transferase component Bud32